MRLEVPVKAARDPVIVELRQFGDHGVIRGDAAS